MPSSLPLYPDAPFTDGDLVTPEKFYLSFYSPVFDDHEVVKSDDLWQLCDRNGEVVKTAKTATAIKRYAKSLNDKILCARVDARLAV